MASTTDMQYVRLGKSGLKVSRIIYGCMSFGDPGWYPWMLSEEEGLKQIKAAYDLGINTFDTADIYSNGLSEVILGKAIKHHNLPRDEIVVMTKACGTVGRTYDTPQLMLPTAKLEAMRYTNQQGLSRKHLFAAIKASLARLQLDYVDVFQCHRFDYNTPIEETMQALHDIVKAGYARYIGMSSCYAWQFYKMQAYAREHGLTEFISMQNLYNPIYREEEREMMPMLKELGVGMIPYSPLAQGDLARPLNTDAAKTDRKASGFYAALSSVPYLLDINKAVEEIAKEHNVTMAQVTIAWALAKGVTAPIVGSTSTEKLKDAIGGIHVTLTEDEVKRIDGFYKPRAVFGHL